MDELDDEMDVALDGVLGDSVTSAVFNAMSFGMTPEALGCFSRWWQLETYLRDLLYIELNAIHGESWRQVVASKKLVLRQGKAQANPYMTSADDQFPIAHLDTSDLLELLRTNWDNVSHGIGMTAPRWESRIEEVVSIRNRIAHLRRPHGEDLNRIEQLLRDLEAGAGLTLRSYVQSRAIHPAMTDPVIHDWHQGEHEVAQRLFDHGRTRYNVDFNLGYSRRPWAKDCSDNTGVYWVVTISMHPRRGSFDLAQYLKESVIRWSLDKLGHIAFASPHMLVLTLSAQNDSAETSQVIAYCYESVFHHLDTQNPNLRPLHRSDPRVDVNGPLSILSWLGPDDRLSLFAAS